MKELLPNGTHLTASRQARVVEHLKGRFCAVETLTPDENRVAGLLSNYVSACIRANRDRTDFGPMKPFYATKEEIAQTEAFKLLREMPKGGLLHVHLSGVGRMDWLITHALASSDCHVHWPSGSSCECGTLLFLTPEAAARRPNYFPVSQKVEEFKAQGRSFAHALRTTLTISEKNFGTKERIWSEFGKLFARTGDFIRYRPIFKDNLLDAFQTLWDDGVYYVELRDSASGLCDIDQQSRGGEEELIEQLLTSRTMMRAKHPPFDCRLILTAYRDAPVEAIVKKWREAIRLRDKFGEFIIGFDLVGEEFGPTNGQTDANLAAVLDQLAAGKTLNEAVDEDSKHGCHGFHDLPYYLHGGESAWADNENLIDAVSMGATRIGHAFNLFRFPSLIPLIKTKDIALELCPISNQLLGLAPDLRTHPAAGYLNAGIQCVLASDDPLFFGNDGLSYDFWEALIAWNLDLAALKKLARNSITYAGMDEVSKANLMKHWEREWDKFINKFAQIEH